MNQRSILRCFLTAVCIILCAGLNSLGGGSLLAMQSVEFPTEDAIIIPQADAVPLENLPPVDIEELTDDDVEVMLRGPVHEAFAEQINADPVPGLVIPSTPPEPVEELAPDVRPEGRDVEWISGYWAWDEDRNDFMWVSGIWREVPQGFRWLPGYWTEVEAGYQWVSGTWVSTQTAEITYLETSPPASLEQGPVGVGPTTEHIWIPGCWTWQTTRYLWRPGYWSAGYSNWIWVPARYHWTPRGHFYCNGYWDYPLERRGVLFAPCYYDRRVRVGRTYRYTPQVVVATNLLQFHFWVRPQYRHYYFGDYYNASYSNRGLQPWHQFQRQHRGIDPLFCHYSRGRGNNVFYNQVNVQFSTFLNNPDRRPSRIFRDQDRFAVQNSNHDFQKNSILGNRLQQVVERSEKSSDGLHFVKLANVDRQRHTAEAIQVHDLAGQRRQVERHLLTGEKGRSGEEPRSGRSVRDETTALNRNGNASERPERLKLPESHRHVASGKADASSERGQQESPKGEVGTPGVSRGQSTSDSTSVVKDKTSRSGAESKESLKSSDRANKSDSSRGGGVGTRDSETPGVGAGLSAASGTDRRDKSTKLEVPGKPVAQATGSGRVHKKDHPGGAGTPGVSNRESASKSTSVDQANRNVPNPDAATGPRSSGASKPGVGSSAATSTDRRDKSTKSETSQKPAIQGERSAGVGNMQIPSGRTQNDGSPSKEPNNAKITKPQVEPVMPNATMMPGERRAIGGSESGKGAGAVGRTEKDAGKNTREMRSPGTNSKGTSVPPANSAAARNDIKESRGSSSPSLSDPRANRTSGGTDRLKTSGGSKASSSPPPVIPGLSGKNRGQRPANGSASGSAGPNSNPPLRSGGHANSNMSSKAAATPKPSHNTGNRGMASESGRRSSAAATQPSAQKSKPPASATRPSAGSKPRSKP